jgi:hypothetical protein
LWQKLYQLCENIFALIHLVRLLLTCELSKSNRHVPKKS